jgi:hypothetical protein
LWRTAARARIGHAGDALVAIAPHLHRERSAMCLKVKSSGQYRRACTGGITFLFRHFAQ